MKTMIPIQFIMKMENIAPQRMREQYGIHYAKTFWEKLIGLMFKKDFLGELVFTYKNPTNIFIRYSEKTTLLVEWMNRTRRVPMKK